MKPKVKLAAAFISAVVILAACGSDDPTQVLFENPGSIRGIVSDNTGATVVNAQVTLTGNAQATRTANSGTDGVYTFANVPPGAIRWLSRRRADSPSVRRA